MIAYQMVGHMIRRLHQISTSVFSKRMQEAGFDLTPVQFAALDAIVTNPGIDQARVAAKIVYDRATIGGVIDRLEQKGYVARRICKHDRRAREVRPTETGRQVYSEVLPLVTALQDELLAGLSRSERDLFLDLASKAVANAGD